MLDMEIMLVYLIWAMETMVKAIIQQLINQMLDMEIMIFYLIWAMETMVKAIIQ